MSEQSQNPAAGTKNNPIVMESDFNYNPPPEADPADQQEFRQSLKDVISEIENEWAPEPEVEQDQQENTETVQPEAAVETAEKAPDEPQDDPAIARGMERLIQREVALQAKEGAFAAREAKVAQLEAEVAQLRSKVPSRDLVDQFDHSPSEAFKSLGHDPEHIVRVMIAEQLKAKGEPVPPALVQALKDAESKRAIAAQSKEVSDLKAQLEAKNKAEEANAFFSAVVLGAKEYVKTVTGSKHLPTLAEIASKNPDRVHREITEEIVNDARARMATDPNGQPLTYEEAAKRAETRLADFRALFGPSTNVDTKQVPVEKKLPPQQKPPARPLKPWEKSQDDIYEQGLQEATREFHRLEAAAKQRR